MGRNRNFTIWGKEHNLTVTIVLGICLITFTLVRLIEFPFSLSDHRVKRYNGTVLSISKDSSGGYWLKTDTALNPPPYLYLETNSTRFNEIEHVILTNHVSIWYKSDLTVLQIAHDKHILYSFKHRLIMRLLFSIACLIMTIGILISCFRYNRTKREKSFIKMSLYKHLEKDIDTY